MKLLPFEPEGLYDILNWKPFIRMEDWMENEVVVNDGGNKGSFSTYRMPHMIRIFAEVDKLSTVLITLMSASQVGKTIILINTILKRLDTDPDNSIIMFPKGNQLKKLYENKVKPYIDGCEVITKKMEDHVDDTKGSQSSYSKKIAGAILSILDANNTKSISGKTLGLDELAEFPTSKAGEALERLKSFDGKGELAFFTSTQHALRGGDDEINHYYNISEVKLQYWAKCKSKECGLHFYPEPETLVYPTITEWKESRGIEPDEEVPNIIILSEYAPYCRENARLQCPHCGNKVTNEERREQILAKEFEWFEVEPNIIDETGAITSWKIAENPKKNYRSIGFDINTLCIEGYHMGNIAQKIVQDTYGKNKINDLQHTWVGYFNRIYRTKTQTAEISDILMLSNKLPEWIVPKDTAKLYFIADTQKNHYWWAVYAVQWGKKFNVVAHGKAEDDQILEDLMFRAYKTEDGKVKYVDRVAIDRRGFQQNEESDMDGNITKSRVNTTERIDELIRALNIKARQNGFIKRDEHLVIGTMGVPYMKATVKQLEEGSYKGEMHRMVTVENKENDQFTIKYLMISNLVAKTEMNEAINNSIENFKNIEEGNQAMILNNLFFINEDMRQRGLNNKRPNNEDFEKMITAEKYDYAIKDGKTASFKTFIPIRRRNDQGDNFATAEALASLDNIGVDTPQKILINPMDFNPFTK
jgi:phage terminase large subunit GpA-like protein